MLIDSTKANLPAPAICALVFHMSKSGSVLLRLALVLFVLASMVLLYLNAVVSTTFSGRKWEVPARVYARPLELYPGAALSAEDFAHELSLLGYRSVSSIRASGQVQRSGGQFEVYTRSFSFPDERVAAGRLTLRFSGGHLRSLHSRGKALDLHRLEPVQIGGMYPRHREDRLLVQLPAVPATLAGGLLAVEDHGYYGHWGISPTGIARASLANYRAGRVVQGGSTLTQQLVKNYYLSSERSMVRKLEEAVMSLLLELNFSKDEILEAYINEVYLGQEGPRAIHGFALASRHYFDLPLEELGLHQQALLVGMVKGASLYNPLRNPERALARRNTVLTIMEREGVINSRPGLGVFVAKPKAELTKKVRKEKLTELLDRFLTEAVHLGFSSEEVLDLAAAQAANFQWQTE